MIFIVVEFSVKPEAVDEWLDAVTPFTQATRSEPGNLWFNWYRSVDSSNIFILVEAFQDQNAGTQHVQSQHFADGLTTMKPLLVSTPKIINTTIEQNGWDEMGELRI